MQSSLSKAEDRVDKNADDERTQKERILQDLTDSLLRVVSGRASRRNSGEVEAMKKQIAAALKGMKQEKAPKAEKKDTKKSRSKSAPKAAPENGNEAEPKGKRSTRKREEKEEPAEHAPAKRARKGK